MRNKQWLIDKKILISLIIINLLGSIYGFYWYREQLAVTPWYLWLFTPDCPLFALLFVFVLLGFLLNKRNHILETITWMGLIKYGIWTVFVITLFFYAVFKHDLQVSNQFLAAETALLISHIGMFIEGCILTRYLKLTRINVLVTGIWFLLSDVLDYGVGVYPCLPYQSHYDIIRGEAIISTVLLWGILFIMLRYKQDLVKNKKANA